MRRILFAGTQWHEFCDKHSQRHVTRCHDVASWCHLNHVTSWCYVTWGNVMTSPRVSVTRPDVTSLHHAVIWRQCYVAWRRNVTSWCHWRHGVTRLRGIIWRRSFMRVGQLNAAHLTQACVVLYDAVSPGMYAYITPYTLHEYIPSVKHKTLGELHSFARRKTSKQNDTYFNFCRVFRSSVYTRHNVQLQPTCQPFSIFTNIPTASTIQRSTWEPGGRDNREFS